METGDRFSGPDEIRELAVTLKKVGITPGECATGCRVSMMMNRLGVGNNQLQSFLSDVYKRIVDLGLTPQNITSYIRDLLEFSNTLVFSQIPAYLEQKKLEKGQLEKKAQELKVDTELLRMEKSNSQNILKKTKAHYNTTIPATKMVFWT